MLIHEVADQIGDARRPARPLLFLVCSDQTRLRLHPNRRRSRRAWTAAREVCSAKWVIDDYTFDLTSMAHVLGEQLAATECARGGYNRRIPIG